MWSRAKRPSRNHCGIAFKALPPPGLLAGNDRQIGFPCMISVDDRKAAMTLFTEHSDRRVEIGAAPSTGAAHIAQTLAPILCMLPRKKLRISTNTRIPSAEPH
jgi:hypothetical protein